MIPIPSYKVSSLDLDADIDFDFDFDFDLDCDFDFNLDFDRKNGSSTFIFSTVVFPSFPDTVTNRYGEEELCSRDQAFLLANCCYIPC